MWRPLSTVVDVADSSRLSLYECSGLIAFFVGLAKSLGNDYTFVPEYFALGLPLNEDTNEDVSDDDFKAAKNLLESVFRSETLQSLHLATHVDHALGTYLNSMVPTAPHLVSYSNHQRVGWP
jgi:hypothetical protein